MEIRRHVLRNSDVSVAMLSLGCITQDWRVQHQGVSVPVVLGYADPAAYLDNRCSMGIIAGRVANRISGARFTIDGETFTLPANEAPNHLHGGPKGLHSRNWETEADGDRAVQFSLTSQHGEGGYPGRLELAVVVTLKGHTLTYEMSARTDRPTIVNLAQHSYYSLGATSIDGFELTLPASRWTPTDSAIIPTGKIATVEGTCYDFRNGSRVGKAEAERADMDANFILDGGPVRLKGNGLVLELETDQPCLQLYTAHKLREYATPLAGQVHAPFSGLCIEPQGYPNAINTPSFPCVLTTPERPYRQRSSICIMSEAET